MEIVRVSGLEPSQADVFTQWTQVFRDAVTADLGDHDERSADELRAMERSPNFRRLFLAAIEDGAPVAAAHVSLPLRDNLNHSFGLVAVLPSHRRRGIGTTLLGRVEGFARGAGRRTLQMHCNARPGEVVPGETFARHHGFTLAQRLLRNDVRTGRVAASEGSSPPAAAPGYRLESTVGLPENRKIDYARFQEVMTTDIPLGTLALEPESWDLQRVRDEGERLAEMGRSRLFTFAVHETSGEAAGFTEIQWAPNTGAVAYQGDTLVLGPHRGHGLGAALKLANVAQLATTHPRVRIVRTWNADDNGPMLAVNRTLGCEVTAHMLEWQKEL